MKIPEKVLAWRETKRRGTIMHPTTFRAIKRKAAKAGYLIPSAVGGKAYWITTLRKYLDEFPNDRVAQRALRQLLKEKGKFKKKALKVFRKNLEKRKWYVGRLPIGLGARIFLSSKKPTKSSHGHLYKYVTGPFKSRKEAEKWVRFMGWNII